MPVGDAGGMKVCSSHNETVAAVMASLTTGSISQDMIYALSGCYSSCEYNKYETKVKVTKTLNFYHDMSI